MGRDTDAGKVRAAADFYHSLDRKTGDLMSEFRDGLDANQLRVTVSRNALTSQAREVT